MRSTNLSPNQSLLDIIITEYGSLEAGMAFALENGIPLSELPLVGTACALPDTPLGDPETVKYFKQNGIAAGTRGIVPPLTCATILKPMTTVESTVTGAPHSIGYYAFKLVAASGFINTIELLPDYLSDNGLRFQTEDAYVISYPYHSASQLVTNPMTSKTVTYKLNWTDGFGYMLVWSDLTAGIKTVTFRDIAGNEAFVAPLIIMDNLSQDLLLYQLADITVETVVATSELVVVRLTRSHPSTFYTDFSHHTMNWIGASASGLAPDPSDPTNPDKAILSLAPGTYTIGVQTDYYFPGVAVFPSSAFTMVLRVS